MRAVVCDAAGGPEVLAVRTLPVPDIGAEEVLIRTAFAGVNRPDVLQRQGLYPPPPGASPVLGLEVSGTVMAAGDAAPAELVGQEVCALVSGGGYAEYTVAYARHCLPLSDRFGLCEAAAVPETLFTVWHNVFERGWARPGETLLVHGGTSGIGTMATLLGKAFGLQVVTTAGSAAKCAASRDCGADLAVNYREEDFVEAVLAFTDGAGADLVLDMVGGDYLPRNLRCLAVDGRHVSIAVLGGAEASLNLARLMMRRHTLTGSTLRARSDTFKALLADEIAVNVWPLFTDGVLAPVMDRTFALEDVAAAHARMEAGEHVGKIVLRVAG
ncbi:NAD(P)H-quinone oxidoreductase [Erythrobacteraceae bacterium CFH 75059]|nr:NAD(P)H-quinone oxidoreductase [Erythrobacteraceae bacterium CFH 75059]